MIQEQPEAISCYVPYLSFNKEKFEIINKNFIEPKIQEFFKAREIKQYEPIDITKYISDLDFSNSTRIPFSYFYEYILLGIKKESGKIFHTIKYGITFDEDVTSQTCKKTKIKYDEILINKKPIFYFIYFDLKDIIQFIKKT